MQAQCLLKLVQAGNALYGDLRMIIVSHHRLNGLPAGLSAGKDVGRDHGPAAERVRLFLQRGG